MPRKYLIDIQKKFKRLPNQGYFTRPKVVLASKSKNSRLKGKVLKQYKGLMETNRAVRLRGLVKTYINSLQKAGLPVLETKVVLTPTKSGKYQLCMVQPEIAGQNILSNYLKTCSGQEALSAFHQMIEITRKVERFNKNCSNKIGLDPKTSNYAIVDGKLTQIDFYPPQIQGLETPADITRHLRSRTLKTVSKVFNGAGQKIVNQFMEKRYSGNYLAQSVIRHFEKERPDLRGKLKLN